MKNLKRRIKLAELAIERAENEIKAAIELANELKLNGITVNLTICLDNNTKTLHKLQDARI